MLARTIVLESVTPVADNDQMHDFRVEPPPSGERLAVVYRRWRTAWNFVLSNLLWTGLVGAFYAVLRQARRQRYRELGLPPSLAPADATSLLIAVAILVAAVATLGGYMTFILSWCIPARYKPRPARIASWVSGLVLLVAAIALKHSHPLWSIVSFTGLGLMQIAFFFYWWKVSATQVRWPRVSWLLLWLRIVVFIVGTASFVCLSLLFLFRPPAPDGAGLRSQLANLALGPRRSTLVQGPKQTDRLVLVGSDEFNLWVVDACAKSWSPPAAIRVGELIYRPVSRFDTPCPPISPTTPEN